jgi:hypothetical protein
MTISRNFLEVRRSLSALDGRGLTEVEHSNRIPLRVPHYSTVRSTFEYWWIFFGKIRDKQKRVSAWFEVAQRRPKMADRPSWKNTRNGPEFFQDGQDGRSLHPPGQSGLTMALQNGRESAEEHFE